MFVHDSYAVVTSPEAWLRLEMVPGELVERVRAELIRLAEEMARRTERSSLVRIIRAAGGYSAFVTIDHEARRVTLWEVGHVGRGGASAY